LPSLSPSPLSYLGVKILHDTGGKRRGLAFSARPCHGSTSFLDVVNGLIRESEREPKMEGRGIKCNFFGEFKSGKKTTKIKRKSIR